MKITFFKSSTEFRKWLKQNHAKTPELLVGFYKKDSGKASLTYPEALDEALCFGWIDGVRQSIDEISYTIRFTPRRPKSNWSSVNIKRVNELTAIGRMQPAGQKIFAERDQRKSGPYSYENRPRQLEGYYAEKFQVNKNAWDFFQAQAPSYQRTAIWWIMSAKKEETRLRRLATLIEGSAQGLRLPELSGTSNRPAKPRQT
jgi:uncharacterized protein YdeI (YjbR/CyaY-like superfamily)